MINKFLEKKLKSREQKNLTRKMKDVKGAQSTRIVVDGKEVLNFCSNNYLSLADDSRLIESASRAMQEEGFGSGASRLVCGNLSAHRMLEEKIAKLKGVKRCLLFSTGYMANVGIISSLFGRGDLILSDRLNHASIVDGIKLSGAESKRYKHGDMEDLKRLLDATKGYQNRVIITDSVFSMDGDWAPLKEIVELAKEYQCMVMIDEAHAFGILGPNGQGLAHHLGVQDDIDIQMGTLSKAAGSFGAYCVGSDQLIDHLINTARSFIYTTALPAPVSAASMCAVDIIQDGAHLREILWNNCRFVTEELKSAGFNLLNTQSPIIPIVVNDDALALEFSKKLMERGIFISAIRPPTVPANSARLRLTVSARNTQQELEYLVKNIKEVAGELCLI